MDIGIVFLSIGLMGIIILLGVLIAIKNKVTLEAKQILMAIIINIAVPSIILNGVFNTVIDQKILQQILLIFLLSVGINIASIFLGLLVARIFRFQSTKAKKIAILSALGNTGFIGIPLCYAIFGPIGGLLAAIYDSGMDIVLFSLVIYMLQSEQKFQLSQLKAILNIPVFAIIIGISLAIVGFQPPTLLKNLTASLSSLAAPMAMLYIGLLLPEVFKHKVRLGMKELSLPLSLKLFIFPLLVMILIPLFNVSKDVVEVIIIQACMPTFMLATVIFSKYTNDEGTAVMTTIYSTLLSLATIPLMTYLYITFL